MAEITTRELKDGLSRWIRRAEAGERLIVTRSGRPVAAIVPLTDLSRGDPSTLLAELEAQGMVRAPRRSRGLFGGARVPSRGKPASESVSEDRL